jgi:hypothetical protein
MLSHITNQVAEKRFLQNPKWCPFKIKKYIQHHNTKALATPLWPPYFSLDNTFNFVNDIPLRCNTLWWQGAWWGHGSIVSSARSFFARCQVFQ